MVNVDDMKKKLEKYDPLLASIAVQELLDETKIQRKDIDKAKENIKAVYNAFPEQDRKEIVSKAIDEVNNEMITGEIAKIKKDIGSLSNLTKEEVSKLYSGMGYPILPCKNPIRECKNLVACKICLGHVVYACAQCIGHSVLVCGNSRCVSPALQAGYYSEVCFVGINVGPPQLDDPIDQMKEKVVDAVINDPKLSKAVKKMISEMKEKKEI